MMMFFVLGYYSLFLIAAICDSKLGLLNVNLVDYILPKGC